MRSQVIPLSMVTTRIPLGQCFQKVSSPMFQAKGENGIACLWLCLSELCQLTYFTDPFRLLLTDEFLLILCEPIAVPRCAFHSVLLCNVRFLKYFLHTFCLVWLCNNPSLLFVWKEAKIWYMCGSLHLDCCLFPFHVITSPMNGALLHLNSNFSLFNLICFAQLQSHSIRTENCVRLTYQ